jgi:hypothetical protein
MVLMAPEANPQDDPHDAAALARYATALADAVIEALPGWAERAIVGRYRAWRGEAPPIDVVDRAREAGAAVRRQVEGPLRALLEQDVDEQRANPLAIVRSAVPHLTAALREAGVPPVDRDAHAARLFPDDLYDLAPAAFADLDPAVHEPGLTWGAAKAHVVLRRRSAPPTSSEL